MVKSGLSTAPELSFSRSDIERRLSLPAGRFTNAGVVLAPLLAVALTLASYGALAAVPEHWLAEMFTQRGPMPYLIVFLGYWSLALLWVKSRKVKLQLRALDLRLLPEGDPGFSLTPATAEVVLERLFQLVDDPEAFLLTRRILHALSNLKNMRRIGDVAEVLRTQGEYDEAAVDSSYTLLRGFIWTLPVLGFIGTVMGLSLALGSFGGVLKSASEMAELRGALQEVTGGLATAFETTLQGLVATVLVHMLMIVVRRREEFFLDSCQEYCQKHLVARLRLDSDGPRE